MVQYASSNRGVVRHSLIAKSDTIMDIVLAPMQAALQGSLPGTRMHSKYLQ